jgi:hypothetical protein
MFSLDVLNRSGKPGYMLPKDVLYIPELAEL